MQVQAQTKVTVIGYYYALTFDAHQHRVGINGLCSCYLGRHCHAVQIVRDYLQRGGPRAQRPPYGFYPVIPAKCPVCHAEVRVDKSLSSANRGMGWRCAIGGTAHYWQHRGLITMKRRKLVQHGLAV